MRLSTSTGYAMSLSDLITKHKKDLEEQSVDWSSRLERWKMELNNLFASIEHALIDAGLDSDDVLYAPKDITEEFIGQYCVDRMTVRLGAVTVLFDPIATLLIGGVGRVDVTSMTNRLRLIAIVDEEGQDTDISVSSKKWRWVISDPNLPTLLVPFSTEKIEYLLNTVLTQDGEA
jgi:hypothetical protein